MYGSTPPGATQTPMYIYACLMRDVHRLLVGDESIYSSAAALFENSITTKRIMRLVLEVNITTFFSYNSTYWWWKSIIFQQNDSRVCPELGNRVILTCSMKFLFWKPSTGTPMAMSAVRLLKESVYFHLAAGRCPNLCPFLRSCIFFIP